MGTLDIERRLYRQLRSTCETFELVAPGDRIMVAVSGGKDSHTLLHFMAKLASRLPFKIELVAVHLDQQQPGYDGASLVAHLHKTGIPFEILSEDTYSVVRATLDDNATFCSLCSRLRRGILYTAAERIGANKIALGHHRDDSLETFMLNLFYSGKLQAMPASYRTDDGRFEVIRPLIECAERDIATFAEQQQFPILPCNLCGSQDGLKRDAMTRLIDTLEAEHPHVRAVMANALQNVRPTHLLDRDLAKAWAARPAGVRPVSAGVAKRQNAAAEPVIASPGRLHLPIIAGDST